MAQVAIFFKEIFDQGIAKRFRLWIVYSELKRHNVSHYIYYLATDNIHIVLENDNTVLIKDLKVVNVKFSRNTHLIKTSYDRLEIKREYELQQYKRKSFHLRIFKWVTKYPRTPKDIYYTLW